MNNKLILALSVICLPAVASAQSSWDVSIGPATGAMQTFQGQTIRVKATQQGPFAGKVRVGLENGYIGFVRLRVEVQHSLLFNNSGAALTLDQLTRQRDLTISKAVLGTAGPGQSFSGTVATSDGGSVAITVVANP